MFGRTVLDAPPAMRLRPLFPLVLFPDVKVLGRQQSLWGWRWFAYQTLRMAFLWASMWICMAAYGPFYGVTVAALYGLTLRFDYWSNSVELLAASLVATAGVLAVPWWGSLACGLVLGLGRETIPMLALAGTGGLALSVGAACSQGLLRWKTEQHPRWNARGAEQEHGESQVEWNSVMLFSPPKVAPAIYVWIGLLIVAFSVPSAPVLAIGMLALVFWKAHLDEPRVFTLLIPFAARTLCGL